MADRVLAAVRPTFRAVAESFVPEAARLDAVAWAEVEDIVEQALARRSAALRRQLRLFIRLLDAAALVRHRHRLRALDAATRGRLLERVQDAPLLLLRRGVWGLRTLVFMGYYARSGAAAEIGYRAHPHGWRAREASTVATAPGAQS